MNKRGTGTVFCFIAAILYATRYLSAALFMSQTSSWDDDLFSYGLSYVGSSLLVLSIISCVIGALYLLLAELEEIEEAKEKQTENQS